MKTQRAMALLCCTFAAVALAWGVSSFPGFASDATAESAAPKAVLPETPVLGKNEKFVVFDSYPTGVAAQMVRDLWLKDPEYDDYVKATGTPPGHAIGMADLNDDGKPEIIVRHTDGEYAYCQPGALCRTHVYVATAKGLVEIGRFNAVRPIIITNEKTNNIRNIRVYTPAKTTYVWDGKAYKPQ